MYKYATLNPISPIGLEKFSDKYEKVDAVDNADAVLVRSAVMHEIELPENVVAVARAGAGVNNIPLDKYASQGVVVFNTPGANANGVKEMVLAGMLIASRDIVGGVNWVEANASDENIAKTAEKAKKNFAGTELKGKKVGVIGLGAIGVLVANACVHLGMEVYGHDPYISVHAAWSLSRSVKPVSDVEDIYRECDFITIHVPLMDATRGMIGQKAIAMMKSTAIILNFARGELCDEEAIAEAVQAGKLRKYVTDFASPATAGVKGVIVTPHLGASTEESEDNCAVMAAEEIMDYLENGNITHSVNYPALSMGVCKTVARITVHHKNVAGCIAQFTTILGDANINVAGMSNASKGELAYCIIDCDSEITDEVIAKLKAIDSVLRVRVL